MVYIILKLLSYTFCLSMKKINGIFTSGTQKCRHKVVDFRWDHLYEQCSCVTLSVHLWFSNITRAVGTTGNHSSLLSVCTARDSDLYKVGETQNLNATSLPSFSGDLLTTLVVLSMIIMLSLNIRICIASNLNQMPTLWSCDYVPKNGLLVFSKNGILWMLINSQIFKEALRVT